MSAQCSSTVWFLKKTTIFFEVWVHMTKRQWQNRTIQLPHSFTATRLERGLHGIDREQSALQIFFHMIVSKYERGGEGWGWGDLGNPLPYKKKILVCQVSANE